MRFTALHKATKLDVPIWQLLLASNSISVAIYVTTINVENISNIRIQK